MGQDLNDMVNESSAEEAGKVMRAAVNGAKNRTPKKETTTARSETRPVIQEPTETQTAAEMEAAIPEPDDYLKRVSGGDFWTVQIPAMQWAIPEVLRMGLGVLIGAQKLGKSTLVTDMALAIATGGKFLDKFYVEQGDVLYLNYEDDMNDLRNRAQSLGYSENREGFPRLWIEFDAPRQDAGGMELILKWVEEHPGRRLLIIDPFIKFRRHRRPDEKGLDAYQHDYSVVGELHSLAVKYSFAILVVQHEKKGADADWVFKSSGSIALTAAANSIIRLDRKRGQNEAKLTITGRGFKEKEYAIEGNGLAWKYRGEAEEFTKSQNINAISEFLEQNGEAPLQEICQVLGIPNNTVKSILYRHSAGEGTRFYKSLDGKRWGKKNE